MRKQQKTHRRVPISQVRVRFTELSDRVASGKEYVIITKNGHDHGAWVSIEDLVTLDSLKKKYSSK